MNYLAHAFLSFQNQDLLVGNMISDFVKGKNQYNYPPAILKGIQLHRAIDTFTDAHPATKQAKQFFKAYYRLYAGAMVDVVFDHFLATDTHMFATPQALQQTADFTYNALQTHYHILPEKMQAMLPFMKQQNWLFQYQWQEGIQKSLASVVKRSQYLTNSNIAFSIFKTHYQPLQQCYQSFFPQLHSMAHNYILA